MQDETSNPPKSAVPPAQASAPAEGLPLPPMPVPGVDFPTFANCYRALHGAGRS
ncbi:MAG: hypothetical protein U5L03_01600 [Burkholderiaceae bacterium]|nr:hypothetical protein [Burkholderiaceae bacterium]